MKPFIESFARSKKNEKQTQGASHTHEYRFFPVVKIYFLVRLNS